MRFRSFDPWSRFRQMQDELNRAVRQLDRPKATAFPPVNIWANEEGLVVTAELPGIDPEALEISALGETLTIRGERRVPGEEQEANWHRRERRYGRFSRTIDLPFAIDAATVDASFGDGLLRIGLRRPEEEKPRKIQVKGA